MLLEQARKTNQVDAVATFNFDRHEVYHALEPELEEQRDQDEAGAGHVCA